MVGRDGELRRLAQLAAAGRPEVVVVAGEPGIGKTRSVQSGWGAPWRDARRVHPVGSW
ncbi:hypothetical protein Athai_47310 [Actinocatenispora thailandica]|uniref:Orc1-like AAA ATPase domain-containing protein n=1 Tax=Actinocatenispora thailandica TaxID=227318 RepID=A0A7R7DSY8_9ACTN|nr:ATP-binding protein [Actinocatenispora thailandica]BCJ37228.1 hypothetical protein Athai_47310 [Actinocatenispora thailandica]